MKLATILLTLSLSTGILGCSDASFDIAATSATETSVGNPQEDAESDSISDSLAVADTHTSDSMSSQSETLLTDTSTDSSSSDVQPDTSSDTDGGAVALDSSSLETSTSESGTDSSPSTTSFALPTHDAFGSCAGSSPDDPFKLGYCMSKGDYIDQGFAWTASMSKATVTLRIDDQTNGCSAGSTHRFDVVLDGVKIGQLAWTTPLVGTAGVRTLSNTFTFASRTPSAAPSITIQAAESVCSGGGSWQWRSGGSVTIQ